MKEFKKICSAALSLALVFSLCVPAFAAEYNNEAVDQGGKVVQIAFPNSDGTLTIIEGDAAQEWYDRACQEGNERAARETDVAPVERKSSFIISIAMLVLTILMIWKGRTSTET